MIDESDNGQETTGDRRTANTLTTAETYKLCLWLDHNRDYLRNGRYTLEEIATQATEAMKVKGGFVVTAVNVRHAAKSIEVELDPRPAERAKSGGPLAEAYRKIAALEDSNGSLTLRFDELEDRYKALHALMVSLSSRLKHLENDLGVTVEMPKAPTMRR